MVLVEGNHDRRAGPPEPQLGIDLVPEPWPVAGVALCHHPSFLPGVTVLAGHLHPCVRLSARAGDAARLPCYWLRQGLWILPAFGEFTGGAAFAREPGDRVVAVAGDRLFEIPATRGPLTAAR
jgi:metallophosphoesterase superfamily enzyme